MSEEPTPLEATQVLHAAIDGQEGAADQLLALVVDELRQMARQQMARQSAGHTLQTTALIHEAWLKLFGGAEAAFEGRRHFIRVAATAMRSVLVDHARAKTSDKRGGGAPKVELGADVPAEAETRTSMLDLDAAIARLEGTDPELARVAELRCFGGLSSADAADVIGVSKRSIERQWKAAKAFLQRELGVEPQEPEGGESS